MKASIFRSLIPLLGVLAVAAPPLLADEKPDGKATKRVKHLIGTLVSRNPAPKLVGEGGREFRGPRGFEIARAVFDKCYDRDLQVSPYLAMQQLLAEGEPALDLLLKHRDDKRYCLTIHSMEDDENVTVGFICTRLFWTTIFPLEGELEFMTKGQYGVYPPGRIDSVEEWWKKKKKIGLAKAQVEAIDAMLDFMQKADAKKASPWHPDAEKVPPAEFEKRRKKNIRILKAVREAILSTGKPYRPRTCLAWYEHIIGLPW